MTIPTLSANIRGKQNANKFRKSIASLSNAARMSMANYGFDYSGLNTMCSANSAKDNPESVQSICAMFNGTLKGTTFYWGIKGLKTPDGKEYNPDSTIIRDWHSLRDFLDKLPVYMLPDGTLIVMSANIGYTSCSGFSVGDAFQNQTSNGTIIGSACYGFIDVNGVAPPNKDTNCSSGTNWRNGQNMDKFNCKVKSSEVNDIFPIIFHDGIVEPYYHSGLAVLNMVK